MGFASHVELWRKGMKANAGQMRKAKRGKRVGEKEGNEKGKQPGRRRPPSLPFSPLSVCPPCLSSSRCTRCSERATSLARSPTYGSPPYVWGEMHCWYGPRPVPRGKSNARISRLSFVLLFTCGQCIAMNSCECSTTNTHSPSFRWDSFPIRAASSLFDAKPLYTPIFGLLIVFTYSH